MVSGLTSGLAAVGRGRGSALALRAPSATPTGRPPGWARGRDGAPGEAPVRMLEIPPDTFDAAYNGIANSVLWFVHHLLFDTPNQPRFGAAVPP